MDTLSRYIQGNLDVVYFIYGTAFAVMGIAVLLQPKKNSGFPLADSLYLLGWFGVIHGANEFLDMWLLIKRPESAEFDLIRLLVLVISYIFLFEFGRRSLRAEKGACSPRLAKAARLMVWQILPAIIILLTGLAAVSSAFIKNAAILSRYLLGFPGALLTGAGLLSYYRCKAMELKTLKARNYFILAGLAFIAYGALGGLIPPEGGFFPANLLNTQIFSAITGLPVQLFRAACAVLISWGMIGTLRIFNWERDEIIQGVVFNNSRDCIANISLDGKILSVNGACLRAYEFAGPWEPLGKNAAEAIAVTAPDFSGCVSRAAKGVPSTLQYGSTGKKGKKIWWDAVFPRYWGSMIKSKAFCASRRISPDSSPPGKSCSVIRKRRPP